MSTQGNVGFARLFFGDAAIVFLLLNDARHCVVARTFGTSRSDSNLVTVVALGSAAVAVHGTAARLRSIPRYPSGAESALGAVLLREAALGIAGRRRGPCPPPAPSWGSSWWGGHRGPRCAEYCGPRGAPFTTS